MTKSGTTTPNTGTALEIWQRRTDAGWKCYDTRSPSGPCEMEKEGGVYWWREIQPDKGKEHGQD